MCRDWTEGLFLQSHLDWAWERERNREKLYALGPGRWALCQLLLWAPIKKKNLYPANGHGSVGLTGAFLWNLPTRAEKAHSKRQQKGRHSAGVQKLPQGACHWPANCQVVLNFYVPPSESQSNNTDNRKERGTMADGLEVWAKGHCVHNGWPLKRCLAWLINQSHHSTIRWPGTRTQKTKQGQKLHFFRDDWAHSAGTAYGNRTSQAHRKSSDIEATLNKTLQQVQSNREHEYSSEREKEEQVSC